MRRIVVLACAVVTLVTAGAGMAVTGDAARGVPAPAASPPNGDEYYTAPQLTRGLPDASDLPAGYTLADAGNSTEVVDYNPCHFGWDGSPWNTTIVTRSFTRRDGGRLGVALVAVGSEAARAEVAEIAAVPRTCPTASDADSGEIRRNVRLPLPTLGDAAAGVKSGADYLAVVALGTVWVGFRETGGDQARFIETVKAGTTAARRKDGPPTPAELTRGLLTTADLPAGYRQTRGDTRGLFAERKCDGTLVDYGTPASLVHRAFVKGGTTIRLAVGSGEKVGNLLDGIGARASACGSDQRIQMPATDIRSPWTAVVYPGLPTRVRAIYTYRDVFTEILATVPDASGVAEIERIIGDKWLARMLDVYYPDSPERSVQSTVAAAVANGSRPVISSSSSSALSTS